MDMKEIEVKLIRIIYTRLSIKVDKIQYENHVFSKKINWHPRVLVYLFFFIQEDFDIEIDKKYILDGSFSTINNIIDIIYEAVNAKESVAVN